MVFVPEPRSIPNGFYRVISSDSIGGSLIFGRISIGHTPEILQKTAKERRGSVD